MNPKWLGATVSLYQHLLSNAETLGAAVELGYDGTLANDTKPVRVNVLRASSRGEAGSVINCQLQKNSTRVVVELQVYNRDSRESAYISLGSLAEQCQVVANEWLKTNTKNTSVSWDFENDGDASAGAYLAWLTANINEL